MIKRSSISLTLPWISWLDLTVMEPSLFPASHKRYSNDELQANHTVWVYEQHFNRHSCHHWRHQRLSPQLCFPLDVDGIPVFGTFEAGWLVHPQWFQRHCWCCWSSSWCCGAVSTPLFHTEYIDMALCCTLLHVANVIRVFLSGCHHYISFWPHWVYSHSLNERNSRKSHHCWYTKGLSANQMAVWVWFLHP